MMTRYLEERTVCKQTTKPVKHYLLSSVFCIFVMLGSLLTSIEAHHALKCPTLSKGDEVVIQNVGKQGNERSGLNVREYPNTNADNKPKARIYDDTTGIILSSEPVRGPQLYLV